MSYTLPLSEAETQLRDLVKRTQTTHSPVLLTVAGSAEPVAVVLEMNVYEQTQRQTQRFYHLQLTHLKQWLNIVERQWDNYAVREECVAAWQDGVYSLWEIAPKTIKEFCAALILSVKRLDATRLSKEHLDTLHYSLEVLRDSEPTELALEKAHQMLIDSGIPALMSFDDDSLFQSYLEEL